MVKNELFVDPLVCGIDSRLKGEAAGRPVRGSMIV